MTISNSTSTKIIIKTFFIVALILGTISATSAWATHLIIKPNDRQELLNSKSTTYILDRNIIHRISDNTTPKSKARAPEPSTIVLFGSGILGMIVSFLRRTYTIAKRAFDVIGSLLAIILLSPLFLLAALLIKLTSRGPILYNQIRVGKDGKKFLLYKFRSMKVDAEKLTGPIWASENDSRLIPVGKFLRKTHLDELPQFLNVLKGDMSIIGPRPERPVFVDELKEKISDYEKRLQVKPGITGLAQVWHRYDETIQDVKKKVKYDLLYIRKMCFWTDLLIVMRTVRVVFTGEGAR